MESIVNIIKGDKFTPGSFAEKWLFQNNSSAQGYRMELLIHSPHPDFLSLSWDSTLQILSLSDTLYFIIFPPSSLPHLLSGLHVLPESEHYEGLPSPRCNPIKKKKKGKKKQELISYLSKMLHFPSSLRTHSQHYQSFDYPVKVDTEQQRFQPPEAWLAHWNPIEGCTLCICLRFGNN